jgi:hypothetical protein
MIAKRVATGVAVHSGATVLRRLTCIATRRVEFEDSMKFRRTVNTTSHVVDFNAMFPTAEDFDI